MGGGSQSQSSSSLSDKKIIDVLAAPQEVHERLQQTADTVLELLQGGTDRVSLAASVELYGSLSLKQDVDARQAKSLHERTWNQDWASYYVNGQSDVDFVVEMKPGQSPEALVQRLLQAKGPSWRLSHQVRVHKFASTQYTLRSTSPDEARESSTAKEGGDTIEETRRSEENEKSSPQQSEGSSALEEGEGEKSSPQQSEGSCSSAAAASAEDDDDSSEEVYLDLTCIEDPVHFHRFKKRQEAFRKVFADVRIRMEVQYHAEGALAFDAYVHLLKAFAAKVPGNALTGFQATCIGLFTLQIGHSSKASSDFASTSMGTGSTLR
jgi:hypothetical protein